MPLEVCLANPATHSEEDQGALRGACLPASSAAHTDTDADHGPQTADGAHLLGHTRKDYHEGFADVYDTLYASRDIAGEARFALEALKLESDGRRTRRILDFGCGTGSHALAIASRGITVMGFDISPAMIAKARAKTPAGGSADVTFASGTLAGLYAEADDPVFDGAVSFFNVLNCIDTPGNMVSDLELIRQHLAPGARMLIEVWNGTAVFADEPRPAVRHYGESGKPHRELIRITDPRVDRISQCCELRYRMLDLDRRSGRFVEFESIHELRFLTPVQYRHLFELSNLRIVDEFPKGKPATPVTEHDWYISYLLQRDA